MSAYLPAVRLLGQTHLRVLSSCVKSAGLNQAHCVPALHSPNPQEQLFHTPLPSMHPAKLTVALSTPAQDPVLRCAHWSPWSFSFVWVQSPRKWGHLPLP